MHSCTCRPRQTLAERINVIISKYETCPCPKHPQRTHKSSLPKIFSSPCLRGSSCNTIPCSPCSPCLPRPAITSSPCCPQPAIVTQPSPGPGLSRYISRRNICPALKGCLSLYKRPSAAHCSPATLQPCLPAPRCNPLICCPKSRPSCATVTPKSRPLPNTKSRGPASYSLGSYCAKCKPCVKFPQCSSCSQSISKSCCPWSENPCVTRQRTSRQSSSSERCTPCSACCYSYNLETMRSPCSTTPCCYSCTTSSELSSPTPCTCCSTSGSSHPVRKRLTVFDDPPYTSNVLEREFSSRFIRLDPCYCETDSSSSLDNSNFGNKFR